MLRHRIAAIVVTSLTALGLLAVATPHAEATSTCRQNVYGYGGTGNCVKAIQALVSASSSVSPSRSDIGYTIARDGSYGSKTTAAVRKYQKVQGLVVDGRVGPKTWGQLCYHGAYWGDNKTLEAHYEWAKSYAC